MLSRTIWGARTAIEVVLLSIVICVATGVPLGLVSGYYGGWFDRILLLVMDALFAFPSFLLAIVFAFLLTNKLPSGGFSGVLAVSLSLSVIYIPQYYRVVRNTTVSAKEATYVEAARAIGASDFVIMRRYLFQNVVQSVPVIGTLNAADAILTLAGLGFLGLGIQSTDAAEWGHDLNRALLGRRLRRLVDGALSRPGHRVAGDRTDPGGRGPERDHQPDAAPPTPAAGRHDARRRGDGAMSIPTSTEPVISARDVRVWYGTTRGGRSGPSTASASTSRRGRPSAWSASPGVASRPWDAG